MKRVLIFSLAYYPRYVSGAEVAIKEITDRISPRELDFHLVTLRFDPRDPYEEKVGNVTVHRVGSGGSRFAKISFIWRAAYLARRLHEQKPFDALWAMMTYMLLPVVAGRVLGVRVPYLLSLQDGDPYDKVFGRLSILPLLPIIDYGFRHAVIIQAISTHLATWPARRGYRGSVVLVPNGFSPASSHEVRKEEVEALSESLGKKAGTTLLITISRLVYQKGIDTVLHALTLLPDSFHLVVVGDGTERSKLEHLVERLGLRDRVHFVGHVDRTLTAQYRAVGDIFVSPSRSEGQGIAFLSSMAAGVPVVATQVGGLADFIFDAKRNPDKPTTAWAVDRDNPEQIAEAVRDILDNPEKAREVAKTARDYVLHHYDWDDIAHRMQNEVLAQALV